MRLLKYLELSCKDTEINTFRALNIGLVPKEENYKKVVESIQERFDLKNEPLRILETLNKELKKSYRGGLKFDFCLDEGNAIRSLSIKRKNKENIMIKWLEACDKLAKFKERIEEAKSQITHQARLEQKIG